MVASVSAPTPDDTPAVDDTLVSNDVPTSQDALFPNDVLAPATYIEVQIPWIPPETRGEYNVVEVDNYNPEIDHHGFDMSNVRSLRRNTRLFPSIFIP